MLFIYIDNSGIGDIANVDARLCQYLCTILSIPATQGRSRFCEVADFDINSSQEHDEDPRVVIDDKPSLDQHVDCSRVVHESDGPAGWVRSGRVTILPDFGGSGQHFGVLSFFTDYFLVPESI